MALLVQAGAQYMHPIDVHNRTALLECWEEATSNSPSCPRDIPVLFGRVMQVHPGLSIFWPACTNNSFEGGTAACFIGCCPPLHLISIMSLMSLNGCSAPKPRTCTKKPEVGVLSRAQAGILAVPSSRLAQQVQQHEAIIVVCHPCILSWMHLPL